MAFKHIYNINFDRLATWFLPYVIRKPKLKAWLIALTWPLRSLNSRFSFFSNNIRYQLIHTSQVIYIEKVLNERYVKSYDPTDHDDTKRIYITEGSKKNPLYIFLDVEQKPLFLPKFINTQQELDNNWIDFIIHVPWTIPFQEDYFKSLVDFYKLAGKTYTIVII